MPTANQDKYRALAQSVAAEQLGIFSTPGWLDQVCGVDNWDACISFDKGGRVIGMMPFCYRQYLGQLVIRMPKLTPFLDIWINYPEGMVKAAYRNAFRRSVLKKLIEQIPECIYFSQHYSYSLTDWLPFYWEDYRQTTLYSFYIPGACSHDLLFEQLKPQVRNKVRIAKRHLKVLESENIETFYELNSRSFIRQGLTIPYSYTLFKQVAAFLQMKYRHSIYFSQDSKGGISAGLFIVHDHSTDYCLASGHDRENAVPGAVQFLLWQAIKKALQDGRSFDFEGSMIPGVAKMFSGFGAEQRPYHKIYKGQNKFMQILNILRR